MSQIRSARTLHFGTEGFEPNGSEVHARGRVSDWSGSLWEPDQSLAVGTADGQVETFRDAPGSPHSAALTGYVRAGPRAQAHFPDLPN